MRSAVRQFAKAIPFFPPFLATGNTRLPRTRNNSPSRRFSEVWHSFCYKRAFPLFQNCYEAGMWQITLSGSALSPVIRTLNLFPGHFLASASGRKLFATDSNDVAEIYLQPDRSHISVYFQLIRRFIIGKMNDRTNKFPPRIKPGVIINCRKPIIMHPPVFYFACRSFTICHNPG